MLTILQLASELPTIRHKGLLATVGKLKTQLEAMVAEIAASRKDFDALRAVRDSVFRCGSSLAEKSVGHSARHPRGTVEDSTQTRLRWRII